MHILLFMREYSPLPPLIVNFETPSTVSAFLLNEKSKIALSSFWSIISQNIFAFLK